MAEPISATTALLLMGGLNAGMGAMKAAQAARQREQEAKIRAAEIEASPWTGRGPSTQVATPSLNPWAEMAGGAVNALGQAAALKQAGLFNASETTTPPTGGLDANMEVGGQNTVFGNIGAQKMSPETQQSVNYFNMKSPEMNPFTRPMSSQSSWSYMTPSLYGNK